MRPGRPPWITAPTLAQSPAVQAGDASLWAERWAGGLRLRIHGVREDDAMWKADTDERILSHAAVDALLACLQSGEDTALSVEAWGRIYTSTWSLDPPSDLWKRGEYVWFYPMSEARLTLRVEAAALREALEVHLLPWWHAQPR